MDALLTIRLKREVKRWYRERAQADGKRLSSLLREVLDEFRFRAQVERAQGWEGMTTSVETA